MVRVLHVLETERRIQRISMTHHDSPSQPPDPHRRGLSSSHSHQSETKLVSVCQFHFLPPGFLPPGRGAAGRDGCHTPAGPGQPTCSRRNAALVRLEISSGFRSPARYSFQDHPFSQSLPRPLPAGPRVARSWKERQFVRSRGSQSGEDGQANRQSMQRWGRGWGVWVLQDPGQRECLISRSL